MGYNSLLAHLKARSRFRTSGSIRQMHVLAAMIPTAKQEKDSGRF